MDSKLVLENDLICAGLEIVSWFSIHVNYLPSLGLNTDDKKMDGQTDINRRRFGAHDM